MAKNVKGYDVVYERDEDGWWVASIPAVPGCHTQGRSIGQARDRIREALSLFVKGARTASFKEDFVLPVRLQRVLRKTAEAREQAAAQEALAGRLLKEAARTLRAEGVSVRDVGQLLGLSHQRIDQISG
jgi:predicted RNase H-like HicB family nuclease